MSAQWLSPVKSPGSMGYVSMSERVSLVVS